MRVFNLSHHKCATRSVHDALRKLGFESNHWHETESLRLLKVHLEGTVATEPAFKKDNTAWGDIPIGLMYRELYQAYPDAVFLFVRRDPGEWVNSLYNHFVRYCHDVNPVHTAVYGYPICATNFEHKTCYRVYQQLCVDIPEFFKRNRNFHLIEIHELGWGPLCKAVKKPVPEIEFPKPVMV